MHLSKTWVLALAFSISAMAQGLDSPQSQSPQTFRQQGRLFTIELVWGEPLRFFVAGKEEGKLDLAEVKMTVRRLKPYPGREMKLSLENGAFTTAVAQDLKDATVLEVKAQSKTKTDKVRFELNPPKP